MYAYHHPAHRYPGMLCHPPDGGQDQRAEHYPRCKAGISKAIITAEFAYFYWLIFCFNKKNSQPKGWGKSMGIYNGTILIPYFIKNKKKFSELVRK